MFGLGGGCQQVGGGREAGGCPYTMYFSLYPQEAAPPSNCSGGVTEAHRSHANCPHSQQVVRSDFELRAA